MKKHWPLWLKWAIPAVCLCAVLVLTLPLLHRTTQTPSPDDGNVSDSGDDSYIPDIPGGCETPHVIVDGRKFYISPGFRSTSEILPEGFTAAGKTSYDCEYYTNPEKPEWVLVYEKYRTRTRVEKGGALVTEPVYGYVRYVDERLRGKDLVCCNGEYYICWSSVRYSGANSDMSSDRHTELRNLYGPRMEGKLPKGFVSAGIAEFSGEDTIPRGTLSCNKDALEVFVNPEVPDVVLVSAVWHTAPDPKTGDGTHTGYDVYFRYDCPFAEPGSE